jgi:phage shock protein E
MYRRHMRNLLLSCIVIFSSISMLACSDAGPPPDKNVIVEALAVPGHLILDVRSSDEYAGGHVDGAVHVPVSQVAERMPTIAPDKDQQIVVYCAVGGRAATAESKLRSMGYTKILNAKTPDAVAKAMGKDLVK